MEASHCQWREVERREVLASERQRLMQDMHDGLGASLTGALRNHLKPRLESAGMDLRWVMSDLPELAWLQYRSLRPVSLPECRTTTKMAALSSQML